MTNPKGPRRWLSGTTLRAASAGLVLTVELVLGVVINQSAQAQTFKVLHRFTGTPDGALPAGGLIQDPAGNLYGTAAGGGRLGFGTVFRLAAEGKETILYSFTGNPDGADPDGRLVRDAAGNLYGTTYYGGAYGSGIVFEVDTTNKTETVLHSFTGAGDGGFPRAGLMPTPGGIFYGTTVNGGALNVYGTVFKIDLAGTEDVLYSFTGGADGAYPYAGLIRDPLGNLYGTTFGGGAYVVYGTVFQVDATGTETVLYSFTGGTDGAYPKGGLVRGAAGNLYGTTSGGGAHGNGTVFEVASSGEEIVLYSFTGGTDGGDPLASLVMDTKGNFYGTTDSGGDYGHGTVFKLNGTGEESVLYSFTGGTDGGNPFAGLVMDAADNLYGTTFYGGDTSCNSPNGCGVVFRLKP